MNITEVVLLSSYLTQLTINFLFIVGFLYRIYMLGKMASNKNQTYRFSFWIKITLLSILVITDVAELILSLTDERFQLNQVNQLALTMLAPIFATLFQMYLIVLEQKKKERPILWHKIYWAYELLATIVQMVIIFALDLPHVRLLIPMIIIINTVGLLVYSLFCQEEHFEMDLPLIPEMPSISNRQTNETDGTELTTLDKPLFIEFNSIPTIHFKGAVKYEFSIAVYGEGTSPQIINRFEEDFLKLQKDMERALNHSEDVSFPELARKSSLSHIGEGQLKVKTYEQFLIRVTRSSNYYVEPLFDFLGITGQRKLRLLDLNKRRLYQGSMSINDLEPTITVNDRKFFTAQFNDETIRLVHKDFMFIEEAKTTKHI